MMGSSRSSVDASVENVYFPYVNTQQLAYVVEVFPNELKDQLDTPSADFLDTFRLRTGEAVYATKRQDAGIETLDIRKVEIVTYWSKDMNAVTERFCSRKNEKECNLHPLCQFNTNNGECTENQLKVIVEYVFTQLENMYNYLTDDENTTFDDDWDRIVDCWLWNGTIKTDIEDDKYEKLENIMTEVAKEKEYDLPAAYCHLLRSAYEIVENILLSTSEVLSTGTEGAGPSFEYLLAKVLNIEQDELFNLPEDGGTGIWDVDRGDVVIVKKDGNKYRAISNLDNFQFQAMKLFNTGIVRDRSDTSVSKKRKASSQGGRKNTNV